MTDPTFVARVARTPPRAWTAPNDTASQSEPHKSSILVLVITGDLLVERLEDEGGPEPLEQRQGDVAEKEGVDLASRQRGGGPRAERGAPEAVGDVRPVGAADRQEAQREGGADQLVGNREDGPQCWEELEEVDEGELRAGRACARQGGV